MILFTNITTSHLRSNQIYSVYEYFATCIPRPIAMGVSWQHIAQIHLAVTSGLLHVWQEHIICYTSAHTSIHACMPWCMQHLWVHSPVRHALCMAPQRVSHPTESRGGVHWTKNNAVVADTCASHMQFVPLLKITLTLPPSRSDCQHSTLHRFHSSGSVSTVH